MLRHKDTESAFRWARAEMKKVGIVTHGVGLNTEVPLNNDSLCPLWLCR